MQRALDAAEKFVQDSRPHAEEVVAAA
jgi:hypothetical protein